MPYAHAHAAPPPPARMPGGVMTARVCLFVTAVFQVLGVLVGGALLALATVALSSGGSRSDAPSGEDTALALGSLFAMGLVVLGFTVWTILTAVKMGKGGPKVRVSGIVLGSTLSVISAISFVASLILPGSPPMTILVLLLNLLSLLLGLGVLFGLANSVAGQWFRRPRTRH
ncbi:hypothetical protein ACN20G_35025 (plasmid) [Streptomyces sp. BI20]|uniref:hypothetical protein n=1 Tax=Streptomyces sp. BI20 TaxID=3403460 RepID=UPI003C73AE26